MTAISGSTALITGGARGLGLAVARRMRQKGARVVLCDLDGAAVQAAAAALGEGTLGVRCDVASAEDVQAAVDAAVNAFGEVDILVNNAAVVVAGSGDQATEEQWRWQLDVNVLGYVRTLRACLPGMRERGRGHLVGVASVAGLTGFPILTPYCTSKFAVVGLYESLAADLAGTGIGVTLVAPGGMATNFVNAVQWAGDDLAAGQGPREVMLARREAGEDNTHGMDPDEAAGLVVAAIEEGTFMVDTHPDYRRYLARKAADPAWAVEQVVAKTVGSGGEVEPALVAQL